MCFGGSAPTPKIIPMETQKDQAITAAQEGDRKRRAAAGGFNSTVLTGGVPTSSPANPLKTLLGQ